MTKKWTEQQERAKAKEALRSILEGEPNEFGTSEKRGGLTYITLYADTDIGRYMRDTLVSLLEGQQLSPQSPDKLQQRGGYFKREDDHSVVDIITHCQNIHNIRQVVANRQLS